MNERLSTKTLKNRIKKASTGKEYKKLVYVVILLTYKENMISTVRWASYINFDDKAYVSDHIRKSLSIERVMLNKSFKLLNEETKKTFEEKYGVLSTDDLDIVECSGQMVTEHSKVSAINEQLTEDVTKIIFNKNGPYGAISETSLFLCKLHIKNKETTFDYIFGDPIPF